MDSVPDKQTDTIILFDEIREGLFQPFTSDYVIEEIKNAPSKKREKLRGLILGYNVEVLQENGETKGLADKYVGEGIIPTKYETDALHIASATVNNLDFIVSWNFKHIVKRKTVIMTESVNLRNGYNKIGIYSPTEVIRNG